MRQARLMLGSRELKRVLFDGLAERDIRLTLEETQMISVSRTAFLRLLRELFSNVVLFGRQAVRGQQPPASGTIKGLMARLVHEEGVETVSFIGMAEEPRLAAAGIVGLTRGSADFVELHEPDLMDPLLEKICAAAFYLGATMTLE